MVTALWIVRGLLALAFLLTGGTKAFASRDDLGTWMAWSATLPLALVRWIGIAEVAGALGLIVPVLRGVVPQLAIVAALGLAMVMVGATIFHATRTEYRAMAPTVVLLVMALYVAVGQATGA